jgi:hypothetical protein
VNTKNHSFRSGSNGFTMITDYRQFQKLTGTQQKTGLRTGSMFFGCTIWLSLGMTAIDYDKYAKSIAKKRPN